MLAELRSEAATLRRSDTEAFEVRVHDAAKAFARALEERIEREMAELAAGVVVGRTEWAEPGFTAPALPSRRVENQLAAVLGGGFGLGVALASGRLLGGIADGLELAGWSVGALLGIAVTVWVVGTRALLHTRAIYDRWLSEVAAAVRFGGEARVATRMLALDAALTAVAAERDVAAEARTARRIAAIDADLRAMRR